MVQSLIKTCFDNWSRDRYKSVKIVENKPVVKKVVKKPISKKVVKKTIAKNIVKKDVIEEPYI